MSERGLDAFGTFSPILGIREVGVGVGVGVGASCSKKSFGFAKIWLKMREKK